MKPFFYVFAFFTLFCTSISAQSIEFAPEGAVWRYERRAGGWGPPEIDYVEVRYEDNIWVDTIYCKRLVAPEGDYYVYQVGEKVYHRRDTSTQFKLLWDFGVMPGDSFIVHSNSEYLPDKRIKFVCTGRDTVIENNVLLPRIKLNMYCPTWPQSPTPVTINPRYGPMNDGYCPMYLFNTYNMCVIDVGYSFMLLHFTDDAFATVVNCTISTDELADQSVIRAVPNPTTGLVWLGNLPSGTTVIGYDIYGQRLHVPYREDGQIDLSNYPNGTYIIDIQINGHSARKIKVLKK